jgi:hypothetical protein
MAMSNSTDHRRIQDSSGDRLDLDSEGNVKTKACETAKTMDSGMWYGEMLEAALADGSSCTAAISTATIGVGAYPHGRYMVTVTGAATVEFYENATIANGSAIAFYNINRKTVASAVTTTGLKNPTVTASGTLLETNYGGTAATSPHNPAAPGSGTSVFWVLKNDEDYIIKVTNNSGGPIKVKIAYQFHEHDI